MAGQDGSPAAVPQRQSGVVKPRSDVSPITGPKRRSGVVAVVIEVEPDSPAPRSAVDLVFEGLEAAGYVGQLCRSVAEFGRRIDSTSAACLLIPVSGPALKPHVAAIESLAMIAPGLRRVLVGPLALRKDPDLADFLMRGLLYDFIVLPQEHRELGIVLDRTCHLAGIEAEAKRSAVEVVPGDSQMVGTSPAMRLVFSHIRKVAASEAPVIISGESGTGKELAARAIHERSPVANGPFVAINCAGIPATLIESELFGYERGAFTGANARKIGRVETAHGGTLFLDEIGDMSLEVQTHLLRFLQESKIERLGGTRVIPVKTRIIVATHIDLKKAVAEGSFRDDLYHRLNVLKLVLPPLRDRGDDVELMANYFLAKFASDEGRATLKLSKTATVGIRRYSWPGNVRELIAAMRRAAVMSSGQLVRPEDLGISVVDEAHAGRLPTLSEARAKTERETVRRALNYHANNVQQAARTLGISRVALYRLIKKYELGLGAS
jgi:DNA-binding NtrC family response regulator